MSEIHYLPGARPNAARVLKRAVGDAISQHPDPDVAALWSAMASETIERWPGPPTPSMAQLELEPGLGEAQRERLLRELERWMESYFLDVRDQMMEMHAEMLSLQRKVAEHEAAGHSDTGLHP